MADTFKNKVANAGQSVADTAKDIGHKVADVAKKTVDVVREKTGMDGPEEGSNVGLAGIRDHMDVIASCGKKVGVVDHVQGDAIKLTKNDSPDGQHHFIPLAWVERVDRHVHLTQNSKVTAENWKSDAAACGCH